MVSRALLVLRAGSLASRSLPLRPLTRLAQAAGTAVGPRVMGTKADQLQRHIERVVANRKDGPGQATDPAPAVQMRRGFGSYARYWIEFFRLPQTTDRTIDRGFSFIGYHNLEAARDAGFGPILILPHLGGWEWAAAWLGRVAKLEVAAVVERLEPPSVFDWFARMRQAIGINVIPIGTGSMAELTAAVKRRAVVCLLADRDIGGSGVPVRFFGEMTTLPAGPALLARRTGAPLLPTAVFYRDRQHVGVVGDPIWADRFVDAPGGRREINRLIMQEVATRLEELIEQAPDQWHLLEPNWPSDELPAGEPV